MAWIIGTVSPSELAELRERGWQDEAPPESFCSEDEVQGNGEDVTRMFYVDNDLFSIMTGPGWEVPPPEEAILDQLTPAVEGRRREEAMDRESEKTPGEILPDDFWEKSGYLVAHDGDVISPKEGEDWICLSGHVAVRNQTGGTWRAGGSSRQTVSGQKGGRWQAHDSSRQSVFYQKGGEWRAHDTSQQAVYNQQGGTWYAYHDSRQIVSDQKGGTWAPYQDSKQTILEDTESGEIPSEDVGEKSGWLVARDGDVISPKAGEDWICLSGHVTVRNQTGGH